MEDTIESKPVRMIRVAELVHKVGLTYQHIGVLEKRGDFPERYYLTKRTPCWLESDVDAWLLARRPSARVERSATLTKYRAAKKAEKAIAERGVAA